MHNFVSILECVNTGGGPCAVSAPSLLLYLVIGALGIVGWRVGRGVGRGDPPRWREISRRGLLIGAGLVAVSFLAIAGFVVFDPDALLGVEENPFVNGMWIVAINAFGLGGAIVLGMLAFRTGGWVATRLGTRGGRT